MVTPSKARHCAPYNEALFTYFVRELGRDWRVLDPFAGTGRINRLKQWLPDLVITGVELEPEWAAQGENIIVGDARRLTDLFEPRSFEAVVTSPTYGNRMADHHNAKDSSKRNTYTHALGRQLSEGNSGAMQWGQEYRDFHAEVWGQVWEVLVRHGRFVLNVKDHIRNGKVVEVCDWHYTHLVGHGFDYCYSYYVPLRGNRQGANGAARVAVERIMVFEKRD
jgi:hypothetical protein